MRTFALRNIRFEYTLIGTLTTRRVNAEIHAHVTTTLDSAMSWLIIEIGKTYATKHKNQTAAIIMF